jgi:hypothetical protein
MKLLRIAAIGAGLAWFLDRKRGPARRARALDAARGLADRARAMVEGTGLDLGRPGEPGAGAREGAGWTARTHAPHPEVHEVKSPAELEPGLFSASPRPTFSSRVDRPDVRARGEARPHGHLPDELEPTAEEWRNDDVTPRVDLSGPPQGSHLAEAHLGVYVPRDDLEAPGRLRAREDDDAERAGRRDPDRE